MEDNIIIENLDYTDEMYKETIEKNEFEEDTNHGIGDDE